MTRVPPQSPLARRSTELVEALQRRFVAGLEEAAAAVGLPVSFSPIEWLRDEGRHGGGVRWGVADTAMYGRASINVSTVHYDDAPERKLASASALSSIVHPTDPRRPSIHLHASFTEMRDGSGYWRVMADLNPSLPDEADRSAFAAALRRAAPSLYDQAAAQGDRYFHIPALDRHRGVSHFYLEGYCTGAGPDAWEADAAVARAVEEAAIDTYCALMRRPLIGAPTAPQILAQLAYHTAYLFQVLTLDRGTTSGLMIHDQNDEGIMGSLPPRVDRQLLASWAARVPPPQDELIHLLVDVLVDRAADQCIPVDAAAKRALASAVRAHYRRHPAALELQASGTSIPPTVENHR